MILSISILFFIQIVIIYKMLLFLIDVVFLMTTGGRFAFRECILLRDERCWFLWCWLGVIWSLLNHKMIWWSYSVNESKYVSELQTVEMLEMFINVCMASYLFHISLLILQMLLPYSQSYYEYAFLVYGCTLNWICKFFFFKYMLKISHRSHFHLPLAITSKFACTMWYSFFWQVGSFVSTIYRENWITKIWQ